MRILYLIKSFDFGGAENHVLDLANSMSNAGNEVFLITQKGSQACRLKPEVRFVSMRMRDILVPFQAIYISYFTWRHKIEVMHAHKRLAILQASLAGMIMGIPVVATVHGRPRYDLRSWMSRRLTDRIIFVNGTTYEANRHSRLFRNKSVLIHNAVEISNRVCEKDHFSILYICRMDRKHAAVISMVINNVLPVILTKFPGITFNIVGDGKYLKVIKEEADILNRKFNREVCKFHGYLQDVNPVVCRSGIVLGVGRVALEALSSAVPVIPLNRVFLGSMLTIENYEFYQFNNFVAIGHDIPDPVKLTSLLNSYFRDTSYWHKEAGELRKIIIENISIEKISADILALYTEACKS